jgi:uncharacterized membrane protein YecN with MAPEG domain
MISFIYTGILGLVLFKLSLDTIAARRKHQISLGTGDNNEISSIVSAHANFIAYTPILLILLGIIEYSSFLPVLLIHALGVVIVLGRVLHYYAFKGEMSFKPRVVGMHFTLWPLLLMSLIVVYLGIKSVII